MRLFLSYSHDDKAWVSELWRTLRDRAKHDVWMDTHIRPAQDWWATILQSIAGCECFIYILTPKSTESIYCRAEMGYAVALNKPILPLILKACEYPADLNTRRIQYDEVNDDLRDALFVVADALGQIGMDILRGNYPPREAPTPPEPRATKKQEQVSEVYRLAEETAANDFARAESLFQQVIEVDPQGWGVAAAERLAEIRTERERDREYLDIVELANDLALVRGAQAAARVFVHKYPDYDPSGTLAALLAPVVASPKPSRSLVEFFVRSAASPPAAKPQPAFDPPILPRSLDLLAPPFDWIDIPAGQVTLEEGGYVPEGGQTFDVPAFTIAKYPLTNAQFGRFIAAQGYRQRRWWTDGGWQRKDKEHWTEPGLWSDSQSNQPNYPVVGISWFEALAFCLWLSDTTGEKIMPTTEQQWQRAAQGDSNRVYPWGDEFDKYRCNFNTKGTTAVRRYEGKGDSPFGVVDMSGNVWEWCLTDYDSGDINIDMFADKRVLRGGSWYLTIDGLRAAHRNGVAPANRGFIGLRCTLS